jgi:hypothetical protein
MGLVSEVPPEALPPAMRLFETLKDVFHPTDLEWLADRCGARTHSPAQPPAQLPPQLPGLAAIACWSSSCPAVPS